MCILLSRASQAQHPPVWLSSFAFTMHWSVLPTSSFMSSSSAPFTVKTTVHLRQTDMHTLTNTCTHACTHTHTHRHTQARTHTHTISKQFTIHQQQKLSMQDIHEHKTCFSHILRLLSYFSDSKFPWLNQLMWSWGSHILPESTFHSSLLQSNDWAWLTVLGTEHPTPLMFNTWAEGGK